MTTLEVYAELRRINKSTGQETSARHISFLVENVRRNLRHNEDVTVSFNALTRALGI